MLAAMLFAAFAPAQVAILQIQVVEGEGMVHSPGSREPRPIVIAVTDDSGKPVSGAAVSFHLPADGPGGTFSNGLRTDVSVTDARGRASVRAFQANRIPGRFQIRILASKDLVRAGTVSFQYVGESSAARKAPSGSRKWIAILAAVAGGGAVAGTMLAHGSAALPAVVAPAPPPVPSLTIGTPSITVGKP